MDPKKLVEKIMGKSSISEMEKISFAMCRCLETRLGDLPVCNCGSYHQAQQAADRFMKNLGKEYCGIWQTHVLAIIISRIFNTMAKQYPDVDMVEFAIHLNAAVDVEGMTEEKCREFLEKLRPTRSSGSSMH